MAMRDQVTPVAKRRRKLIRMATTLLSAGLKGGEKTEKIDNFISTHTAAIYVFLGRGGGRAGGHSQCYLPPHNNSSNNNNS